MIVSSLTLNTERPHSAACGPEQSFVADAKFSTKQPLERPLYSHLAEMMAVQLGIRVRANERVKVRFTVSS